jgi:regulator of sigma E protease
VGIGLFNLFPIPMLDGGHLVFFLWEGLREVRPVPMAREVRVDLRTGTYVKC